MALAPNLGNFSSNATLVAAFPAISVQTGTTATVGSQLVISNGTNWASIGTGGTYDVSQYPGVVQGVLSGSTPRTANGTALQAAFDYCAANSLIAMFPAGRFEYIATTTDNSINTGLQARNQLQGVLGNGPLNSGVSGSSGTVLVQFATNYPVLTLGGVGASTTASNTTPGGNYGNFTLGHGVTQASQTSAYGLLLGNLYDCSLDKISVNQYVGGFHSYIGCGVGVSSSNFFFQNHIGLLIVNTGLQNIFKQVATTTGNDWDVVYLGGGGQGNRVALADVPMWLDSSGGQSGNFNQLNIEWCNSSNGLGALRIDNGAGCVINNIHIEGDELQGYGPGLFYFVALLNSEWVIGAF